MCHLPLSDYSKGFGGKYGVEKEKVDKAAMGYDYKGETEKHQSQKGDPSMAPHNHFIIIIIIVSEETKMPYYRIFRSA